MRKATSFAPQVEDERGPPVGRDTYSNKHHGYQESSSSSSHNSSSPPHADKSSSAAAVAAAASGATSASEAKRNVILNSVSRTLQLLEDMEREAADGFAVGDQPYKDITKPPIPPSLASQLAKGRMEHISESFGRSVSDRSALLQSLHIWMTDKQEEDAYGQSDKLQLTRDVPSDHSAMLALMSVDKLFHTTRDKFANIHDEFQTLKDKTDSLMKVAATKQWMDEHAVSEFQRMRQLSERLSKDMQTAMLRLQEADMSVQIMKTELQRTEQDLKSSAQELEFCQEVSNDRKLQLEDAKIAVEQLEARNNELTVATQKAEGLLKEEQQKNKTMAAQSQHSQAQLDKLQKMAIALIRRSKISEQMLMSANDAISKFWTMRDEAQSKATEAIKKQLELSGTQELNEAKKRIKALEAEAQMIRKQAAEDMEREKEKAVRQATEELKRENSSLRSNVTELKLNKSSNANEAEGAAATAAVAAQALAEKDKQISEMEYKTEEAIREKEKLVSSAKQAVAEMERKLATETAELKETLQTQKQEKEKMQKHISDLETRLLKAQQQSSSNNSNSSSNDKKEAELMFKAHRQLRAFSRLLIEMYSPSDTLQKPDVDARFSKEFERWMHMIEETAENKISAPAAPKEVITSQGVFGRKRPSSASASSASSADGSLDEMKPNQFTSILSSVATLPSDPKDFTSAFTNREKNVVDVDLAENAVKTDVPMMAASMQGFLARIYMFFRIYKSRAAAAIETARKEAAVAAAANRPVPASSSKNTVSFDEFVSVNTIPRGSDLGDYPSAPASSASPQRLREITPAAVDPSISSSSNNSNSIDSSAKQLEALLQNEKQLRHESSQAAFKRLATKKRLQHVQDAMSKFEFPPTSVAYRFLKRMEEQLRLAAERWEQKRQHILAERQRNTELVLAVYTSLESQMMEDVRILQNMKLQMPSHMLSTLNNHYQSQLQQQKADGVLRPSSPQSLLQHQSDRFQASVSSHVIGMGASGAVPPPAASAASSSASKSLFPLYASATKSGNQPEAARILDMSIAGAGRSSPQDFSSYHSQSPYSGPMSPSIPVPLQRPGTAPSIQGALRLSPRSPRHSSPTPLFGSAASAASAAAAAASTFSSPGIANPANYHGSPGFDGPQARARNTGPLAQILANRPMTAPSIAPMRSLEESIAGTQMAKSPYNQKFASSSLPFNSSPVARQTRSTFSGDVFPPSSPSSSGGQSASVLPTMPSSRSRNSPSSGGFNSGLPNTGSMRRMGASDNQGIEIIAGQSGSSNISKVPSAYQHPPSPSAISDLIRSNGGNGSRPSSQQGGSRAFSGQQQPAYLQPPHHDDLDEDDLHLAIYVHSSSASQLNPAPISGPRSIVITRR